MVANREIRTIQTTRKVVISAALCCAALIVMFSSTPWNHSVHHGIESLGMFLIVVCILGRTWCSIYIVGRKNKELIARGPYSICRNPLYGFSIIGAAGIGALAGSLFLAVACAIVTWLIFYFVVLSEEKELASLFGDAYRRYHLRVPRFLPVCSLYANEIESEVRLVAVFRTFADSCVFLLALPLVELLEYLKAARVLPVLVMLP